jgi:uncharacterized protein (DUF1697 family)
MASTRHVALLRGINVGGNNIIKMTALKAAFEEMGVTDVVTYIQSGNVVFASKAANKPKLTKTIEDALGKTFSYSALVVVVTADELARVVSEAPPGFGTLPARYRYDVLFVKPPLMAREALASVPTKPSVDEVHAGGHALYFRRSIAKASESRLSRLVSMPLYKSLTIRNWNTTTKLLALLETR